MTIAANHPWLVVKALAFLVLFAVKESLPGNALCVDYEPGERALC
jgi:hypothetical protein